MVNLKICNPSELVGNIHHLPIVCFGAGKNFSKFLDAYPELAEKIVCVLDNNVNLQGQYRDNYPILSVQDFLDKNIFDFTLIITALHYGRIFEQINSLPLFDGADCFITRLNDEKPCEDKPFTFLTGEEKIPRVIHYCWFGKKKIPDHLQKYINSWKNFCPDYEIVLWNEENYDVTKNTYMHQAYAANKLGFVPDYARLDIIYEHGGIYLDTDVELVKSLDDFLPYTFFCGFERNYVAFGLGFGAVKQHPLIKKCLDYYDDLEFIQNGELNLVPSPKHQSKVLTNEGFLMNGQYQEKNGAALFPTYVFCPGAYSPKKPPSEHLHSIHHFEGSWLDADSDYKRNVQRNLKVFRQLFLKDA